MKAFLLVNLAEARVVKLRVERREPVLNGKSFGLAGPYEYPVVNRESAENYMTVRDRPLDPPQRIAREKWRFVDDTNVALDGGFELGRIYDVVYRARDPRVLGCVLAGTRDLISFLKHATGDANPVRGIRLAVWLYT
jgi:hypothetical protein